MLVDLTLAVSEESESYQWALKQKNKHAAMGHVGTHLDTYLNTVIPLEYFKSEAIIFDVCDKDIITSDDIDVDCISVDSFVLFYSGRMKKYGYENDAYFKNHPQLSDELLNKLMAKPIRFIGLDFAGVKNDHTHSEWDEKLEQQGIYVIENLTNLEKLLNNEWIIYTSWIYEKDLTGLKCRVIAEKK